MAFKLAKNSIVKLNEQINNVTPGCVTTGLWKVSKIKWSTGLYQVAAVKLAHSYARSNRSGPYAMTYFMQRIKKDGTPFGKMQAYLAQEFDANFIATNKAEIIAR